MIRISLSRGIPVKVVDAATVAGTAKSIEFCIPPIGAVPTTIFSAVGAHSALNGNIECTQDDGVTWRVFIAFDFIAQKVMPLELNPGVGYRFNFTTVTGGPSDILASLR